MAQGVCWVARELGVPATVVAPDHAPRAKLDAVERLGGRVVTVPFDTWWETMEEGTYPGLEGLFVHPVLDERVMAVMRVVPRHLFVPLPIAAYAYQDRPLPIGFDKTISQPFMVALMTDLLAPRPHEAVLEIGTGLGYQTAVLAELSRQVWSVEIVEEFTGHAEALLQALGHANVGLRVGDGSRGWPEHAPFDKILVTVAAERPPPAARTRDRPAKRSARARGGAELRDKHRAYRCRARNSPPVESGSRVDPSLEYRTSGRRGKCPTR